MNRMERVEDFPKNFLKQIFSSTKKYDLGKYPDQTLMYKKLGGFLRIDTKKILLSSGMDGGIKTIFEVLTKPGDKVGVLSPTYAMYKIYSNLFKTKLKEIGYNKSNFRLDYENLIKFIKTSPQIIFIPNPNQPIEDPLSVNELKKICSLSLKYKVLVVIDEAYNMFGTPSAISLINKFNNLIILRTFSKSFGVPSIRFGYLISNVNTIRILSAHRLSYETNFLTDTVASYLIDNIKIVKKYIDRVKKGRDYLLKELKKLKINAMGGKSSTVLINFNNKILCDKIYKNLIKNKIYVKGNYSPPLDTCILIACGPKNLMERLLFNLKVILKKNSKL